MNCVQFRTVQFSRLVAILVPKDLWPPYGSNRNPSQSFFFVPLLTCLCSRASGSAPVPLLTYVRARCEDIRAAGSLLKHCYLSCAREDLNGTLRRFRAKISVRTRAHGLLDEDRRGGAVARGPTRPQLSLPCCQGTLFHQRPPATCKSGYATLVLRWRKLAARRCGSLAHTTPRPPLRES